MIEHDGASADKKQRTGAFEWVMKLGNKRSFHKYAERLTQH